MNPTYPFLAAATVALAQLFAGAAGAQAATDVACTRCVGTSDLGNSSVNSSKILNNSVTSNDLAPQSVKASAIVPGAVTASKLAPDVRAAVDGAIENLTTVAAEDAATGVAAANCPSGRIPVSASCLCDDQNENRNYGVLFACAVDGNGAVAACFDEAETFNPTLPSPLAIVQAICLGAESTDGTPWVPTAGGLARYSPPPAGESGDVAAAADWHRSQQAAFESRLAELRERQARHRSRLLR